MFTRLAVVAAAAVLTLTACSSGASDMSSMNMSTSTGSATAYTLTSDDMTEVAGSPAFYKFAITTSDGMKVTDFAVDQTKKMHFYAIRADLTGFQHVHPVMAADGTWTASLSALTPGTWTMYASFIPVGATEATTVHKTVTVAGNYTPTPLPTAAPSTTVDGYLVTVAGTQKTSQMAPLTVSITKNGTPVTDLQPYLDTYAHLTAFHESDLTFAHLHPLDKVNGAHGGPTLNFHADFTQSGNWRLFLQFQTAGILHTAALTLAVS
jgi:hypothetical protein